MSQIAVVEHSFLSTKTCTKVDISRQEQESTTSCQTLHENYVLDNMPVMKDFPQQDQTNCENEECEIQNNAAPNHPKREKTCGRE